MRDWKTSWSMRSRPVSDWPSPPHWIGRFSARDGPAPAYPEKNPRGTQVPRGSIERFVARSVDDLDDPARPRLDDHPPVIDDGIAIFPVARHRPQFDRRRQGLTDNHPLPH